MHESAHAITALALGLVVLRVAINDDDTGVCTLAPTPTNVRTNLHVSLAGAAAEEHFDISDEMLSSDEDFRVAREDALSLAETPRGVNFQYDLGRAWAASLVRENERAILVLAEKLYTESTLTGEQIDLLLRRAKGNR